MKIDQTPINRILPGNQTQPEQRTMGAGQATEKGTPADQASVTHFSQALHDSSQDIDAARVAEIRDAIANGTLVINSEKIAAGLIASLQQELQQES